MQLSSLTRCVTTRLAIGVAVCGVVVAGGAAVAPPPEPSPALSAAPADPPLRPPWTPPGDTIVRVAGDRANGFTIDYYDGSSISPPTDSEATAECEEYHSRLRQVQCRVQTRTWYRDLGATKRALRYAHSLP